MKKLLFIVLTILITLTIGCSSNSEEYIKIKKMHPNSRIYGHDVSEKNFTLTGSWLVIVDDDTIIYYSDNLEYSHVYTSFEGYNK